MIKRKLNKEKDEKKECTMDRAENLITELICKGRMKHKEGRYNIQHINDFYSKIKK